MWEGRLDILWKKCKSKVIWGMQIWWTGASHFGGGLRLVTDLLPMGGLWPLATTLAHTANTTDTEQCVWLPSLLWLCRDTQKFKLHSIMLVVTPASRVLQLKGEPQTFPPKDCLYCQIFYCICWITKKHVQGITCNQAAPWPCSFHGKIFFYYYSISLI